ncbi:MAG TPA: DUF2268 domain-containing putative Zn-dependent protease [Acidimicrobiia bacterium]|nr:DUF2268 domain-containing putative Zn-dependent protease [Acidimicrobiia bacterium]
MFVVHFLDTDACKFTAAERKAVASVVAGVEDEVRPRLPLLDTHVNVTVEPSDHVIPELGIGAFTPGRHLISVRLDPRHGSSLEAIIESELFSTLVHEACHAARYVGYAKEASDQRPIAAAVFEGLGTVFEREVTGRVPPWGSYDPEVIDSWIDELLALPGGTDSIPWRFTHPDGRRWIAYRAGTRVIERACGSLGVRVPDLLTHTTDEILTSAGLQPTFGSVAD